MCDARCLLVAACIDIAGIAAGRQGVVWTLEQNACFTALVGAADQERAVVVEMSPEVLHLYSQQMFFVVGGPRHQPSVLVQPFSE